MATIPLPALHGAPIQQGPGLLEMYGQALGIKNAQQEMAQRQAMAPMQQAATQQALDSGALDLRAKEQAVQDQTTLRTLTPKYVQKDENGNVTGYNYAGLFDAAAGAGVSPNTLSALQKGISDATMAKANATKAQLENDATVNAQAYQRLEGIRAIKDPAQRQQAWQAVMPWVGQNAATLKINPGMLPASVPDDGTLNGFEAMLGMHAQQLKDADTQSSIGKNNAQAQEAQANTQKTNAETDFYAKNGGAPGVPVDAAQQADWMAKNPGKGPSDYKLWVMQHSPQVIVQGMSNGQAAQAGAGGRTIDWGKIAQHYGMTPGAFDQTAEKYFQTGQLPQIGRSPNAIAMNRDIMSRTAELHPNESLAAGSAEFKANGESLKKLQASADQVEAFENTANKNIEMLEGLAQKVPDLGSRWANIPVRMLNGTMLGADNMAAFKTALAPVQTEAAKILNSANLQGQLSDSARHELQDIVDGNLPYSALVSSLNVLQQDFKNRRDSYSQQIGDIKSRMQSGKTGSGDSQNPSAITVTAPNGRVFTFSDQASANVFKKEAGIQ